MKTDTPTFIDKTIDNYNNELTKACLREQILKEDCQDLERKLNAVTEQRDELLRYNEAFRKSYYAELARAKHYKQQSDRMVEALKMLMPQKPRHCHGYDQFVWDNADEALAAVEGGSDE